MFIYVVLHTLLPKTKHERLSSVRLSLLAPTGTSTVEEQKNAISKPTPNTTRGGTQVWLRATTH